MLTRRHGIKCFKCGKEFSYKRTENKENQNQLFSFIPQPHLLGGYRSGTLASLEPPLLSTFSSFFSFYTRSPTPCTLCSWTRCTNTPRIKAPHCCLLEKPPHSRLPWTPISCLHILLFSFMSYSASTRPPFRPAGLIFILRTTGTGITAAQCCRFFFENPPACQDPALFFVPSSTSRAQVEFSCWY